MLLKADRNLYLDTVTTNKSTPGAAAAVWDQLTSFLRTSAFATIALTLVIAFVAWVIGPSSAAAHLRGCWHQALGRSGGSVEEAGPIPTFVARSKNLLRGIGATIAVVVLIMWTHPSALTVLAITVLFVVYLALIEFIGRNAQTEQRRTASS